MIQLKLHLALQLVGPRAVLYPRLSLLMFLPQDIVHFLSMIWLLFFLVAETWARRGYCKFIQQTFLVLYRFWFVSTTEADVWKKSNFFVKGMSHLVVNLSPIAWALLITANKIFNLLSEHQIQIKLSQNYDFVVIWVLILLHKIRNLEFHWFPTLLYQIWWCWILERTDVNFFTNLTKTSLAKYFAWTRWLIEHS